MKKRAPSLKSVARTLAISVGAATALQGCGPGTKDVQRPSAGGSAKEAGAPEACAPEAISENLARLNKLEIVSASALHSGASASCYAGDAACLERERCERAEKLAALVDYAEQAGAPGAPAEACAPEAISENLARLNKLEIVTADGLKAVTVACYAGDPTCADRKAAAEGETCERAKKLAALADYGEKL